MSEKQSVDLHNREKSRQADVVFEIKSRGHATYIYLFLEFQSTVDRFMAMRMGRYVFEFYEEIRSLHKDEYIPLRYHEIICRNFIILR